MSDPVFLLELHRSGDDYAYTYNFPGIVAHPPETLAYQTALNVERAMESLSPRYAAVHREIDRAARVGRQVETLPLPIRKVLMKWFIKTR